MPSERAEGWYWIRVDDSTWLIALWNEDWGWTTCGNEMPFGSEALLEVGERIPDHE